MDYRISATELARHLGDILGRIRYRGDSFTVERNGTPVARIGPVAGPRGTPLREAMAAWINPVADPGFADDLERIRAQDRAPANPWDWSQTRAR